MSTSETNNTIDPELKNMLCNLLLDDQARAESHLPKIYDIPISEIDDFRNHPYQVRMDEDMGLLVKSIKEHGVITPVKLRKKDGGRYEMISGHRRMKACEILGYEMIRAEVMEMTHDEAIILMVESNLQRSTILPSEKANAYKMHLEAIKRQGQRTDLTSSPLDKKLHGITSAARLGENTGESQPQIYRYIRLTELISGLLNMVDEGRIALRPAVELSYMKQSEQVSLLSTIMFHDATPSLAQAIKLKKLSQEGQLSVGIMHSILAEEKPNQVEKFSMKADLIRRWIPKRMSQQQAEAFILRALEHYSQYLQKHKKQE